MKHDKKKYHEKIEKATFKATTPQTTNILKLWCDDHVKLLNKALALIALDLVCDYEVDVQKDKIVVTWQSV